LRLPDAIVNDDSSQLLKFKQQEILAGEKSASSSLDWYKSAHGIRSNIEVATALRHLRLTKALNVLDAGAGVGRVTLELARHARSVVAMDISDANVKQLLKHAEERGLTNVEALAADLNEVLLEESSFDRAVAVEVLQHIPSGALRADAVMRISRALKPDGIFVTINNRWRTGMQTAKDGTYADGRYRCYFSPSDMTELLLQCGFSGVTLGGCVNLPYRLDSFAQFAPRLTVGLDVLFSSTKASLMTGQFLLAIARK
jgi:SAM-dependent methyltransferase